MNYQRHYDALMIRGQSTRDGYLENHHIIPKCLGGSDDTSNISRLTPEEHFVAHQLLVKLFPNNPKIALGAFMMTYHNDEARVSNKLFGWLRRKMKDSISKINKANAKTRCKKAGNSQRGKQLSKEHKQKLSDAGRRRITSEVTKAKQREKALNRTDEERQRRLQSATSPEVLEKYRAASANKVWMINKATMKTSFTNRELVEQRLIEGWLRGRSIRAL